MPLALAGKFRSCFVISPTKLSSSQATSMSDMARRQVPQCVTCVGRPTHTKRSHCSQARMFAELAAMTWWLA